MTNLYLCKILCNRKSLLSGAVQKEHWPFLGWGGGLNCQHMLIWGDCGFQDCRSLQFLLNYPTEDLVNFIHRIDHSLVKSSIITLVVKNSIQSWVKRHSRWYKHESEGGDFRFADILFREVLLKCRLLQTWEA